MRRSNNTFSILLPFCLMLAIASTPATLCSQSFTAVTSGDIVTNEAAFRSAVWIDYDKDGYLDLFVTNQTTGGSNFLYHNDGPPNFTFTRVTNVALTQNTTTSVGTTWADYDNDGYPDAFVTNYYSQGNQLYHNNGDGTFTEQIGDYPVTNPGYSGMCAWGDFNGDGLLDLIVGNAGSGNFIPYLYKNLGNGQFLKITNTPITATGGSWRSMTWIDYDNDGDEDLFITNDKAGGHNMLFKNLLKETGVDSFVAVTDTVISRATGFCIGAAWGDYDNDGFEDLFIANYNNAKCFLFHNNGDGTFTRIDTGAVVNTLGYYGTASWVDVDNDGDLDLFITQGYAPGPTTNVLYKNMLMETGHPGFVRVTTGPEVTDLGSSLGFTWGDFNEDGNEDLFVANTLNEHQANALYINNGDGSGNSWIDLDCFGTVSNRSAVGAKVKAKATINGNPVWQTREIEAQGSYGSEMMQQHFGFGNAGVIDSLLIAWPSGRTEVHTAVPVNRHYSIIESDSTTPAPLTPANDTVSHATSMTLLWRPGLSGRPFRIQISTDSTFASNIVADTSGVEDTSLAVLLPAVSHAYFWRVQSARTVYTNRWSPRQKFVLNFADYQFTYASRWNLVSVPVLVSDFTAAVLFPDASSAALAYSGAGYAQADTLAQGGGYWLKYDSTRTETIHGSISLSDTFSVNQGWNLIGSAAFPIPLTSITTIPEGILHDHWFGYRRGYYAADTVMPAQGYWVKSEAAGKVVLNVPLNAVKKAVRFSKKNAGASSKSVIANQSPRK